MSQQRTIHVGIRFAVSSPVELVRQMLKRMLPLQSTLTYEKLVRQEKSGVARKPHLVIIAISTAEAYG